MMNSFIAWFYMIKKKQLSLLLEFQV